MSKSFYIDHNELHQYLNILDSFIDNTDENVVCCKLFNKSYYIKNSAYYDEIYILISSLYRVLNEYIECIGKKDSIKISMNRVVLPSSVYVFSLEVYKKTSKNLFYDIF